MILVDTPDGNTAEFPDGTHPDIIRRAMRDKFGGGPAKGIADEMLSRVGGASDLLKGAARGAVGFAGQAAESLIPPPFNSAGSSMRAMQNAPEPTPEDIKKFGSRANYYRSFAQPDLAEKMVKGAGLGQDKSTFAGTAGEFAGNPMSWFGPGGWIAKTLMTVAGSVGSETAGQLTEGTAAEPFARIAGSMIGGPVGARAVRPKLGAEQQALADAGVSQMTPGQMFPGPGGMFKNLEDAATSIPILGSFIRGGQRRSIESFNKAVANQALEPIGEKLSKGTEAGHDLVTDVGKKLGDAYDNLLPNLNYVPDAQFAADMSNIHANDVAILPKQQMDQFQAIIDSRMGPPAPMSGTMLKSVESELNHISSNYLSSADAAQRGLGQAIQKVITAIRDNLERSNPDQAAQLASINAGYAMFARIRDAAARRTTSEGVFTPQDLLAAIKKGDKSVAKGAFARGDALMQTFAEAGQSVLPSKMPNSGTPERLLSAGLLGGGAAGAGHLGLLATPAGQATAVGVGGAIAPYTGLGMSALNRWANPKTTGPLGFIGRGRKSYRDASSFTRAFLQGSQEDK